MSDEEKKAIEDLKDAVNEPLEVFENVVDTFKLINLDQCRIVLNLIEKQQKEIEEKNIAINKMSKDISSQLEEIEEKSTIIMAGAKKVKQLEKEIEELKENELLEITENFISKDKIREKLKELEEQFKKYENEGLSGFVSKIDKGTRIEVLKELLEEK